MKAYLIKEYGGPEVLTLSDKAIPEISESEVLVKVKAVSINPYDRYLMRGRPYLQRFESGMKSPDEPSLGQDFSGVVESVGAKITEFKVGDEVFGDVKERFDSISRSFAEFVNVDEDSIVHKPTHCSFVEAASIPTAGRTAFKAVRQHGNLKSGESVLINGASGGVGTFAVQIAKALGANVTAVCSTRNIEMLSAIGADHIIDYSKQSFVDKEDRYDLIIDIVSSEKLSKCIRALNSGGRYVWVGAKELNGLVGPLVPALKVFIRSFFSRKKLIVALTPQIPADLRFLKELVETGKVKPVIDRIYPFQELPDAIRYLENGHTQGKVVVTL